MTASDSFTHDPLDFTQPYLRLVDVLPRSYDGGIRCKIRHELQTPILEYTAVSYELQTPILEYTAVSYEWGDPDSDMLNIHVNNRPFAIRQNLHWFLQCLLALHPGGYNSLWVDALCIDQHNDAERNHQVQQMKRIYQKAKSTLVWLGPAARGSNKLFDFLNGFNPPQPMETSTQEVAALSKEQWRAFHDEIIFAKVELWQACDVFSQRSYWSRTWILQELLLSPRPILFCGTKMCPWSAWAIVMAVLTGLTDSRKKQPSVTASWTPFLLKSSAAFISQQWFSRADHAPADGLVDLIIRFQHSKCSINHDRVYGLLGLASDGFSFPVDYHCTLAELYQLLLESLDWSRPYNAEFAAWKLQKALLAEEWV